MKHIKKQNNAIIAEAILLAITCDTSSKKIKKIVAKSAKKLAKKITKISTLKFKPKKNYVLKKELKPILNVEKTVVTKLNKK